MVRTRCSDFDHRWAVLGYTWAGFNQLEPIPAELGHIRPAAGQTCGDFDRLWHWHGAGSVRVWHRHGTCTGLVLRCCCIGNGTVMYWYLLLSHRHCAGRGASAAQRLRSTVLTLSSYFQVTAGHPRQLEQHESCPGSPGQPPPRERRSGLSSLRVGSLGPPFLQQPRPPIFSGAPMPDGSAQISKARARQAGAHGVPQRASDSARTRTPFPVAGAHASSLAETNQFGEGPTLPCSRLHVLAETARTSRAMRVGKSGNRSQIDLEPTQIHPKSTRTRPKIDPKSTPDRPNIGPSSTRKRPEIDPNSTLHRPNADRNWHPPSPKLRAAEAAYAGR